VTDNGDNLMKKLILASAAALAFTAAPAAADHHMEGEAQADAEAYAMSEAQQQAYMTWSDDQRIAYQAWPVGVQEYYWTLTPDQTDAWWVLTDPQRVRVYEMTPDQRMRAWQQINTQMGEMETAETAQATATTSTPQMRFVSSAVVQTTPADAGPPDGELPVCTSDAQDNCINAWEAGKRGPGVNRPLEYWPGRPASEIDEPLPATQPESD
jgi:hypothetical protein